MSKKSKAQKQAKKKRQQRERKRRRLADASRSIPKSGKLARADELIARRRWGEAREVLEGFDRAKPGRADVLRRLLDVYHGMHNYASYCRTCRKLLPKFPDDPALHVMYAGGLLNNARLASSLLAFRNFIERWPDHPFAAGAGETIARLEKACEELTAETPFPPEECLELAALHEEVLSALQEGDDDRCIQLGEELHLRCPQFLPVRNNLSEAYFRKGRVDEALAMSKRVLEQDPQNIHALGNQARYLLKSGHRDEAAALAAELRSLESDKPDLWSKQTEIFSFLGDDEAVIEAVTRAEQSGARERLSPDNGLLFHLAGVAFARQGDWSKARQYWQTALQAYPGFDLAQENLEELRKPPSDRHGPFPFFLNYWMRSETMDAWARAIDMALGDGQRTQLERFVERHPAVAELVPLLLDHGDDLGRKLAYRTARLLQSPPMIEHLREFCLSQRGPDRMRIDAANFLSDEGHLPNNPIRMWQQGQWRDVVVLSFDVVEEPMGEPHSPQVEEWAQSAYDALQRHEGETAERLLKRCLEVEPDKPDLLNNLASAYQMQGRYEEHESLVREIHERFPDYFFARVGLAMILLDDGDLDQAEELLAPLLKTRTLHATEFSSLCAAKVRLMMKRGNHDAAESWIDMWHRIMPDDQNLRAIEARFAQTKRLADLKTLLTKS